MQPDDDDPVLGDYLDEWLERRRTQLRPSTTSSYRRTIEAYLRPHLGSRHLSELDRRTLDNLYAHLLAAGGRDGRRLSPRTVQLAHTVLHGALKDAQVDGLITSNPTEHANPPKHDHSALEIDDELQVWTVGQTARFLDAVDDTQVTILHPSDTSALR